MIGDGDELAEKPGRRGERNLALGFVADHAQVFEPSHRGGLVQEPALTASRLPDDQDCRNVAGRRSLGGGGERCELVCPADERAHLQSVRRKGNRFEVGGSIRR